MTTLIAGSASNGGVKTPPEIFRKAPWATLAMGCVLSTVLASAQVTSEPESSAMISPKAESTADGAIEPRKPSITEESTDDSAIAVDPTSLLPDLPPVPKVNATLVGGTIERVDPVRDKITVHVFGGGKESILFDPRTRIYRGQKPVTTADLHEGERIYLDTILDGTAVFARTIRLTAARATGSSQGVILKYRSDRGQLTFRDALSPNPVEVRVTASTKVEQGGRAVALNTLVPGALVSVNFDSEAGGRNTAKEISILAQPGTRYIFAGKVLHIDLRTGLLVLNSSTDRKTYEVYLAPSMTPEDTLQPGVTVTVVTDFDGQRYVARNLTINSQ